MNPIETSSTQLIYSSGRLIQIYSIQRSDISDFTKSRTFSLKSSPVNETILVTVLLFLFDSIAMLCNVFFCLGMQCPTLWLVLCNVILYLCCYMLQCYNATMLQCYDVTMFLQYIIKCTQVPPSSLASLQSVMRTI